MKISETIRVLSNIVAPVLLATGVGAPIAMGIQIAAQVGIHAADQEEEKKKRNEAERQKRAADERVRALAEQAEARRREVERELQHQRQQVGLTQRVMDGCRLGNIEELPALLRQLDQQRFDELGLNPVAACEQPDVQAQIVVILNAERERREAGRI